MKILTRFVCVALLFAVTIGASFAFYGGKSEQAVKRSIDDCIVPKGDYFYKYEEPVKVSFGQIIGKSFAPGEEPGNNCINDLWEELLNADFEIKYTGTMDNISTQVNVAMISDDLPDVTPCNETMFGELYVQDKLCDLTDYYEYYASPALKQILEYNTIADISQLSEEEKQTLSGCNLLASAKKVEDGSERLYAIPLLLDKYTYCPYLWIRQDWLDRLGAQMPTTQEEVLALARRFKNEISECSYPIYTNNIDFIYEWFGGIPSFYKQDYTTGEWSYSTTEDSFRTSIDSFRSLINEGLVDSRLFSEAGNAMSEVKQGKVGIYIGYFWQPQGGDISIVAKEKNTDWNVAPLPDSDGNPVEVYSRPNIQNYYVVSNKCEHPELLFIMLNHMVEEWVNPTSDKSPFMDRNIELMESPKYSEFANYLGEWGPVIFDEPDKNYFVCMDIRDNIANGKTEKDLVYKYAKNNYRIVREYINNHQTPASNNYNWIYYKIFYESSSLAINYADKMNYGGYFGTATPAMLSYAVAISNVQSVYTSRMLLQSNPVTVEQFKDFKDRIMRAGVESVLQELEKEYKYKWWKGGSSDEA